LKALKGKAKKVCALLSVALMISQASPTFATTTALPVTTSITAGDVTVVNNFVGTPDTVTLKGSDFSNGDIVNLYANKTTKTPLATAITADGTNDVVFSTAQIGQAAGNVYVTNTTSGDSESARVAVQYIAEVTPSIDPSKVTITNGAGSVKDTVAFTGLIPSEKVTVSTTDSTPAVLGTATAKSDGTVTVTLATTKSLSDTNLGILVTGISGKATVSPAVTVLYGSATVSAVPTNITVTNNIAPTKDKVTFIGLKAKDVVNVYKKGTTSSTTTTATNKLGTATAPATVPPTGVVVTLSSQLNETDLEVEVTVTSTGCLPSPLTSVPYFTQAQTPAPPLTNMLFTNDAVMVVGLAAGDTVTVYPSLTSTTKTASTKVKTGDTYAVVTFRATAATAPYVTVTAPPAAESPRVSILASATTPAAISASAIAGVTTPVTGATATTSIPDTMQYKATSIKWQQTNADGTSADMTGTSFATNTTYSAIIVLTPQTGYSLQDLDPNFFTVNGVVGTLVKSTTDTTGTVTVVFPPTSASLIGTTITGVTAPAIGAVPTTIIPAATGYTSAISWASLADGTTSSAVKLVSSFAANTTYAAIITLTPTKGYTVAGLPANAFTLAGATGATVTNAAPATSDNSVKVYAIFPSTAYKTGSTTLTPIPSASISIPAPSIGAIPLKSIPAGTGYTASIAWVNDATQSPFSGAFAQSTTYAAIITLTPTIGYAATNITDFTLFKVNSALPTYYTQPTSDNNKLVLHESFPQLPTTIPTAITLTAPVTGQAPLATITTTQYTGTVSWQTAAGAAAGSTFAASTAYTATITLTPLTGYTVTGVAKNSYTVTGATVTNNVNSGVAKAVFSSTAAASS